MRKMTIQEMYDRDDEAGRKEWEQIISGCVKDYYFTPIKDYVDCFLTGNTDTTYAVEIKKRKGHLSTDFNGQWILEKKKYNNILQRMREEHQDRSLYINIFEDLICAWDITDLQPEWYDDYFSKTTTTNYKKGEVKKSVTYLKPEDAIWKRRKKLS